MDRRIRINRTAHRDSGTIHGPYDARMSAPSHSIAEPIIDVALVERPVGPEDAPAPPPGLGGECMFLGRTRPESHPVHGELDRLEYEAHVALAIRTLRTIAAEIAADHGCGLVRIRHATGPVPVGAASVLVQAASPHRPEAFAAARAGIDRLKLEVPIWKRECWSDGTTWSDGTPVPEAGT